MKQLIFFIGLVLSVGTVSAQKETTIRILNDDYSSLRMEIATGTLTAGETTLNMVPFSTLNIEGCIPSSLIAEPTLPVLSRMIEVPLCEGFEVEITDAVYDTVDLQLRHQVVPAQAPRSKSDTLFHPIRMIEGIYDANKFYGQCEAMVEAVGIARDRRLARLQFSPVRYNPVSGQVIVCRHATVTVRYQGTDRKATEELFNRYYSPTFNNGANAINKLYPKGVRTTAPVRYLIVAHSMFRNMLDGFVQWKQRKGFRTDIVYTDNPAVGSDTTSISNYIKSLYTNATAADPAPTYVLLVGDVEQLPPFNAHVTSPSSAHVTDLYYMTWTVGDHIPDCHYGRFSAQNESQLVPQIEKTLMYEQYTFADPSFLDRAVMVAGVDRGNDDDYGYTHADPTMDYAITNYVNGAHGWSDVRYFKNNTSIVPQGVTNVTVASNASSMSDIVRTYYNQGAGLINYSAHGSATSWGTPNFTTSHVSQMTNNQKFGLMIGNCCLTNKFEETTCLGEALLRKSNYAGAVGYIGGSNSTYWGADFYWAVGVRSNISASMSMAYNANHLGVYDRTFHTHNESFSNWCTTLGSMVMQGDMSVEASSTYSDYKHYYWEIYHLMGDPSVMPYMTQADTMPVTVASSVTFGTTTLPLTVVPNAYVALVDTSNYTLIAAAYANNNGSAVLTLPVNLTIGTYLLAVSAQQYRTAFRPLQVFQPVGAFPIVTTIVPSSLNAGDTVALTLHIENRGTETAYAIAIFLTSGNPLLTLSSPTLQIDSLPMGAAVDLASVVSAYISDDAPDSTFVDISAVATWTGSANPGSSNTIRLWLLAPILSISFSNDYPSLFPGTSSTLIATLHNGGNAPTRVYDLSFTSPTALLPISNVSSFSLAANSDTAIDLSLQADAQLPQGITIPVTYHFGSLNGNLPVYIGPSYAENFEGDQIHLPGFDNSFIHPWFVTTPTAYEGTHSMRSDVNMDNYDTSEMSFSLTVVTADSCSFYYKVSSEENYDKFFFIIDGEEQFDASGETDWTRASFFLNAGQHTLTFRYIKDVSRSLGSDCAWIDNLVLPHVSHSVTFSHVDGCVGAPLTVLGDTINTDNPGNGARAATATDGSVTIVDYSINASIHSTTELIVCDTLIWNGTTYTSSTSLLDTLPSVYGCDSIVDITLTVNHSSVGDTLEVATAATTYEWYGAVYSTSGTYQQVFTNSQGCDSTITLLLTINGTQGIAEIQYSGITIYPNPTTGFVQFSQRLAEVVIYDAVGHECLRQSNVNQLDLTDLAPGIYTLRTDSHAYRIVKQ